MAYTAGLQKLVVSMGAKSGIPADAVQFDLHYLSPAPVTDVEYDAMADHINDFLNTVATGMTNPVRLYLGNTLSTAADKVEIRFYDMPVGGGAIGAPVAMRTLTLGTTGTTSLPEEVAAVLSFRGDYGTAVEFSGSTRPRARLRNRIYLGPLGQGDVEQDTVTKRTKVLAVMIADVMASAIQYLYTEPFPDGWLWRIVSPTAVLDHPVTFVAMDNSFDTQRRRGPAPSARAEAPVV